MSLYFLVASAAFCVCCTIHAEESQSTSIKNTICKSINISDSTAFNMKIKSDIYRGTQAYGYPQTENTFYLIPDPHWLNANCGGVHWHPETLDCHNHDGSVWYRRDGDNILLDVMDIAGIWHYYTCI